MIFHRARRLLEKADRITMIPSFEVLPRSAKDETNSINMSDWTDPGSDGLPLRVDLGVLAMLRALVGAHG